MKKFEEGDILINTIKAHPKTRLLGYGGQIYVDNTAEIVVRLNQFFQVAAPSIPPILNAILTESGIYITTEGGIYLITDAVSVPSVDTALTTEAGLHVITEDDNYLLIE